MGRTCLRTRRSNIVLKQKSPGHSLSEGDSGLFGHDGQFAAWLSALALVMYLRPSTDRNLFGFYPEEAGEGLAGAGDVEGRLHGADERSKDAVRVDALPRLEQTRQTPADGHAGGRP